VKVADPGFARGSSLLRSATVHAVGSSLRPCVLCGATARERAFDDVPALDRCTACGLVVTRSEPGDADLYERGFFSDDVYYAAYFARADQWRHEARLRLDWLLGHVPRPTRLLEIGSGGGFFVEAATAAGIDAEGVEPAPDGASYAQRTLGVRVAATAFEEAELAGGYDVVCGFHVLEHVQDPGAFLEKARGLLVPGGRLALEVPNIASSRSRREGSSWAQLQPQYHVSHFAPDTLSRLVESRGYEVVVLDTVFPLFYRTLRSAFRRSGVAENLHELRSGVFLRRRHPSAGDFIRLLARPA
jgi:cyclopropane fatty-acyl-phospholipid synthase-like methyltransferase